MIFLDRTVFILMISRSDIKQENLPRMPEIPRRDKEFSKKVRISVASVPENFRADDNPDIADGEADMAAV
jgi:hypothetical protein